MRHFVQDLLDQARRASAYIARVESGELSVRTSEIVIFETAVLLERRYRRPKPVVRDALLGFLELPGVTLPGKHHFRRVFDLYVNMNLEFADAYHVVLMERLGLDEIVTFDRGFDRVPTVKR